MTDQQKSNPAPDNEAKSLDLLLGEFEDVIAKVSMKQARLCVPIFKDGVTVLIPDDDPKSAHLAESGTYEIFDLDDVSPALDAASKAFRTVRISFDLLAIPLVAEVGLRRVITPEGKLVKVIRKVAVTGDFYRDYEQVKVPFSQVIYQQVAPTAIEPEPKSPRQDHLCYIINQFLDQDPNGSIHGLLDFMIAEANAEVTPDKHIIWTDKWWETYKLSRGSVANRLSIEKGKRRKPKT